MRITIGGADTFLFEVYAVDFGDNYHRMDDEPSSELERAARKIRRRYRNISDYLNAMAVYQEYMAKLMLKHGGPQLFKIKLRDGLITDFVPAKPRMKNNKLNKVLLKKKIVVSRVDTSNVNEEVLEDMIKKMSSDVTETDLIVDTKEKDKVAIKMMKEGGLKQSDVKSIKHITDIDYLEEYFRNKNIIKEKKEKKKRIPLSDIISGKAFEQIRDTSEQDDIVFYRGNYLNRQAVEELQMYQKLGEMGWNSIKIMKNRKVSDKITKLVKNQNKENKKKKKKRQREDDFLVQVVMDGGYDSFGEFEEEMLNFTSDQIFGR